MRQACGFDSHTLPPDTLAKTKSRKKYSVGKEARRRARQVAGLPPAERVLADKRRKPPKHKKSTIEEEFL